MALSGRDYAGRMPVLVTGAAGTLARRIAVRILADGGEVRAYGSTDSAALRAAGAHIARGDARDEARLEAALTDVHTVIHVGAGLLSPDPASEPADVDVMLRAATNARVSRVIALSLPGAASDAADPLRRAKAGVEARLAAAALPTIVVRASLVDTATLRDALATTVAAAASVADVEVAPVPTDDLVELVAALDAARSSAQQGHLVVAADGVARMSLRDFLTRTAAAGGLRGRRVPSIASASTLEAALDGPWCNDDPVVPDAWTLARVRPRPVTHA